MAGNLGDEKAVNLTDWTALISVELMDVRKVALWARGRVLPMDGWTVVERGWNLDAEMVGW